MALNRDEINSLIKEKELISGYVDLEVQLTPNGFDLTLERIFEFDSPGAVDFSNKERLIPKGKELLPEKQKPLDKFGWWTMKPGAYKALTNETINLSNNLIAVSFPRSSLLRMGAFTQTGVWDAGFRGKSEFILVVQNQHGIKLKQNARLIQLVFLKINEINNGYQGIYQSKK